MAPNTLKLVLFLFVTSAVQIVAPNSDVNNTTTNTTDPTPTQIPDICDRQPCPFGSQCEARANDTRACLCMAGDSFNEESQSCESAKVFPGGLLVLGIQFENNMTIKTSPTFQQTAKAISDQIDRLFEKTVGYSHSIVLELKPILNTKVNTSLGISATMEIIFETSAKIKTQEIVNTIAEASKCEDCLLANSTFANTNLCSKKPCDEKNTECLAGDNGNFNCKCLKGYIITDYSERFCVACPSGQTPNGTRACMNCPFGYSGFNCKEVWKLALVIVGSVLGGLLLITVIVMIVLAVRTPKKTSKTSKHTENTNTINVSDQDPLVTSQPTNHQDPSVKSEPAKGVKPFPNGGVPKIPRATAASAWDNNTNLEMTPSNSRQNLVNGGRRVLNDSYEEMNDSPYNRPRNQTNPFPQTRTLNNPYAESRAVNNPYAQSRPQTNPYARNQGQANPSYSSDDGRPFNY